MGDTENSSSRSVDLVSRNQRLTLDVFNKVLCRLKELNDKDASLLGFEDELWTHFCRLPTQYAMDVNAERAEDVIMHKRLLQLAHNPDTRPKLISITPSLIKQKQKSFQSLKAKSDLQGVAGGKRKRKRKRKRKKGSRNAEGVAAAATDALSTTTTLV